MKLIIKILVILAISIWLVHITPQSRPEPTPPAEPEPPLLKVPERVQPLVPSDIPKPLPPPKIKEEPEIICTDDCPLIEVEVRAYFSDTPILAEIARCESQFRQFDEEGKPLMNAEGSSATGVMQILASVHEEEARKYGLDIRQLYGNLAYAKHLYEQQGTKPWEESRDCWSRTYVMADGGVTAQNKGISDT